MQYFYGIFKKSNLILVLISAKIVDRPTDSLLHPKKLLTADYGLWTVFKSTTELNQSKERDKVDS